MVCKKRPANRVAIALAAFVGLSATTTVAFAEPRGDNAPTMPLGAADRAKILHGNAERLLKL